MRQIRRLTIILSTIVLIAWACEKVDDTRNEIGSPYGAEYFKCDLNGIPFKTDATFNCSSLKFSYSPEPYLGAPEGYCIIWREKLP